MVLLRPQRLPPDQLKGRVQQAPVVKEVNPSLNTAPAPLHPNRRAKSARVALVPSGRLVNIELMLTCAEEPPGPRFALASLWSKVGCSAALCS